MSLSHIFEISTYGNSHMPKPASNQMESWNHGIMESWNHGSIEAWENGKLKLECSEALKHGNP